MGSNSNLVLLFQNSLVSSAVMTHTEPFLTLTKYYSYLTEPPKIYGPRKFHANVGESARLICKSRGYPYASFTWSWKDPENKKVTISEGEEIRGYDVTTLHSHATSQSTLEISKVTKENWRMYTCEVVNSLSNDSALFTLSGKSKYFKTVRLIPADKV